MAKLKNALIKRRWELMAVKRNHVPMYRKCGWEMVTVKKIRKLKCEACKDTGVIETGNNDLPCHCEKGDMAMFNVTCIPMPVSGRWLKAHRYGFSSGSSTE